MNNQLAELSLTAEELSDISPKKRFGRYTYLLFKRWRQQITCVCNSLQTPGILKFFFQGSGNQVNSCTPWILWKSFHQFYKPNQNMQKHLTDDWSCYGERSYLISFCFYQERISGWVLGKKKFTLENSWSFIIIGQWAQYFLCNFWAVVDDESHT